MNVSSATAGFTVQSNQEAIYTEMTDKIKFKK